MAELSEESIELASIRSKLGMTIRKFAERLGEPEARYKNWEYGLTKRVPYPILQKARSLIQPSDVTDIRSIAPLPTVRMPYAGDLPAGDWGEPLQSGEFEDVDARYFKPNRFCSRIVGGSCSPALQPGDFTIWESNYSPAYGKIVVASAQATTVQRSRSWFGSNSPAGQAADLF